jgi:2-polyprenyl-3-methyl-5-hydroxy-6-metoxy-1,4-benzoquinol methylase
MSNYSDNDFTEDKNTPWYKILQLVPGKSRVLDVGCSSGNLGATLKKEKNCEVVGLDVNEDDVKKAAKRLDAAYVMNAETDDLSSLGKFDCIIFADVIEHLVDPVQTLEKVKGILNSSGVIIFSIPNMAHLGTRLMLLEGRFVYGETGLLDKTHLHYYDRQEVERVFKEAGFRLTEFDWVERFLPERVVKNQLENIGLIATETFFNKSREVESTAYEFIGKVVPSTDTQHSQLPFVSPYVGTVEEQINNSLYLREKDFEKEKAILEREIDELLHKEARLISSISWRITLPLRLLNGHLWYLRQRLRILIHSVRRNPRYNLRRHDELKKAQQMYAQNDIEMERIKKSSAIKSAVVVHLYYTESWSLMSKEIKSINKKLPLDLYVTIPEENQSFKSEILHQFPDAHIFVVPNRGRDVLPFIQVAKNLERIGYEYVLKLHSKKSPHRKDGQEWFGEIMDNLTPVTPLVLTSLKKVLENEKTAIVGPKGQYVSLKVNYDANSFFLFKAFQKLRSKSIARQVGDNRSEYGFFAGTMFWARLDSISEIINKFEVIDFEHEGKHIDGTFAHATERLLCVLPEIDHRDIYEIGPEGVKPIDHASGGIPDWSDVFLGSRS